MVTPTQAYTDVIVRNGTFQVIEIATGRVFIMSRASTFTFDNGLGGKKEITELDNQGYIVKTGNSFSERKPRMTLNFSDRNLDNTALQLNQKTQQITLDLKFPYRMQVNRATYAASATGKLGFGIVENAVTLGSYHDPQTRETINLTQQDYATFNSATPKSFAIGANFERLFSDDLVTDRNWIVLAPEAEYTARAISEEQFGFLEIIGICYRSSGKVSIFHVPRCFVDPEGAGITADNQVAINFDISGLGVCQPWNEYEVDVENFCEAA